MNDGPTLTMALANVSEVWSAIVSMIGGNIWLLTFLACGLVASAFRIFKRAKKAVR